MREISLENLNMTIYIIELIIIAITSGIGLIRSSNAQKTYLIIVFFVLFLVSGLRASSVGSDTLVYGMEFQRIASSSNFSEAFRSTTITAPVYVAYNWLIGHITNNYQVILLFNAAVVSLGVGRLIYKTSSSVAFSAFCFFGLAAYFQSMNGMRQYIAVVFAINAYVYFAQKGLKSVRGWLLFLVAVGMHSTALIFLIAIAGVCYVRVRADYKAAVKHFTIAAVVCVLLIGPLMDLFVRVFPYYALFLNGTKYDILGSDSSGRIVVLYTFLAIIVLLAYNKLGKGRVSYEDNPAALFFPVVILAVVFGFAFTKSFLMNRLVWYFIIGFVSFIPYAFQKYSTNARILMELTTVAALLVWCSVQLIEDKSSIVPYTLCF